MTTIEILLACFSFIFLAIATVLGVLLVSFSKRVRDIRSKYNMARISELNAFRYQELNQVFQDVLNQLPCALCIKEYELGNRYRMASHEFYELFHLTPEQVIGYTDFDIFPREYAERIVANDVIVMQSLGVFDTPETLPDADGNLITFFSHKCRLKRSTGDLLLCVSWIIEQPQSVAQAGRIVQKLLLRQAFLTRCLSYFTEGPSALVLNHILSEILNELQAFSCRVFRFDKTGMTLHLSTQAGAHEGSVMPDFLTIDSAENWYQKLHANDFFLAVDTENESLNTNVLGVWANTGLPKEKYAFYLLPLGVDKTHHFAGVLNIVMSSSLPLMNSEYLALLGRLTSAALTIQNKG